jgi:hypothetical protein
MQLIRRSLVFVEVIGFVVALFFGILWLRNPGGPYEPVTFVALLIAGTGIEIIRRYIPPHEERTEPETLRVKPPTPSPRRDVKDPSSSIQTNEGEVDLRSRADKTFRVTYSEPFGARPNLEIKMHSSFGNRVGIEEEDEFGFTIVKPSFWVSASGTDIVQWRATGQRRERQSQH